MSTDPSVYLTALEASFSHAPDVQATIATLRRHYDSRFWFELSESLLESFPKHLELQGIASDIYDQLIVPCRVDFPPMTYAKLVYFVVFADQHLLEELRSGGGAVYETLNKKLALLDSAAASLTSSASPQGVQCVSCTRALLLLLSTPTDPSEGRRLLDRVESYVSALPTHELEPLLRALLLRARIQEFELERNYTKFYTQVFDMVLYSERSGLPLSESDLSALAYKTVIAALLSDETFNFGRLLTFPAFTKRLSESPDDAWLLHWAELSNSGSIVEWEGCVVANEARIAQIADVQQALPKLRRKARLMALLHLVFYTPAEERVISFAAIRQRCLLASDAEVEELALTALAQQLLKGSMDGIDEVLRVSWVQPRVLSLAEVRELSVRVGDWATTVRRAALELDTMVKACQ